ncbi:MAG: DUF3987 domain-containing protein [Pleurocapsa sp. MO_226.B13]|nr:DUF3987 domain-containing protein [Pleurocapsa sp. MO_226.B13]
MNNMTTDILQLIGQNHQSDNPSLANEIYSTEAKPQAKETKSQIKKNFSNDWQNKAFNILDHIDKLEPAKGSERYICPVCDGNDLTIDPNTGKYQCWHGCECSDIREAISPWSDVVGKNNNGSQFYRSKKPRFKSKKPTLPTPLPENKVVLATLPEKPTDIPIVNKTPSIPDWLKKQKVPDTATETKFSYSNNQWVSRFEWQDEQNPKGHRKTYRQGHIKPDGTTKWSKGKDIWLPYKIDEAIANAKGKWLIAVEGEPCVETLRSLLLAGITFQGSNWNSKAIEPGIKKLKNQEVAGLIYLRDNDDAGREKAQKIANICNQLKFPYLIIEPTALWSDMPSKGDIVDWVKHYEGSMKRDDFIRQLESAIHKAVARRKEQKDASEESATENNKVIPHPSADTRPVEPILIEQIDEILAENLSQGELDARIITLASNFSRGTKDIWKLYYSRSQELERVENLETTKEEVNRLLKIQNYQIKLRSYLQPQLAEPLEKLAKYLGVNNATLLTTLLTTSASLLPIDTKLELIKATSFYARPILYSGICAPSGSSKSPAIKAILDPLFELQKEEDIRYQELEEQYRQDLREYKKAKNSDLDEPEAPPPPREYFVTDSTSEAIALIQNNQPKLGFLGYFDELKQLIGQSNSYRGGKGADIEKLLSGRDGSGFKVNRASGKRISCPRSGYSIIGGIQPEVLRKQMGDFSDGNGFWARFIWVNQPMQRKPFPNDEVEIDISPLLRSLYEFLGTIDNTFVLSSGAKEKYKNWYEFVEEKKLQEARPALQAVWSKSQRLVGELALLLHCLTYAIHQQQPPKFVEPEILNAAIRLAKFYIGQIELIHADGEPESSNQPNTYTKLIELSKRKGWITARDVKASIRSYRDQTPSQVRSLFREIESLGYGTTQGVSSVNS